MTRTRLRNGSFYPCSACVQRFEIVSFGTFTCMLECLIVLFRPYRDGATLTRRLRTQCQAWAALTVLRREFDLDDLVFAIVDGRRPTATHAAFWTGRLFGLPINLKLSRIKSGLLLGLPFVISTRWTNQINFVVLLAPVQQLGIDIASIDNVLIGQKLLLFEAFMDSGCPRVVGDGSRGRFNMRNQVRAVFLTGFGEMNLEAHPTGGALRGSCGRPDRRAN